MDRTHRYGRNEANDIAQPRESHDGGLKSLKLTFVRRHLRIIVYSGFWLAQRRDLNDTQTSTRFSAMLIGIANDLFHTTEAVTAF